VEKWTEGSGSGKRQFRHSNKINSKNNKQKQQENGQRGLGVGRGSFGIQTKHEGQRLLECARGHRQGLGFRV